jgi:HD superfamily phosphohydrolase
MVKALKEIRYPIHVFDRLDREERKAHDSRPFQPLRNIHQLALTYLVYPGATHKRFEHSLGVMELAGRVFDILTSEDSLTDDLRRTLPELRNAREKSHWRTAVRMAALFHDVGHLPFSHAAEKELLPEGWTHERISALLIRSDEMKPVWQSMHLDAEDVVKLALGPREASDLRFSPLEAVLSEIVVGDAFGVDRMDYLLRDSHHVGVAYGKFDHYRLIDTLRILPQPPSGEKERSSEPTLGIEHGGLQSAEALSIARYLMYSQVYLHHTRRIYDIHLKDFLREWLPENAFSINAEDHLKITDNEISAAMWSVASDPAKGGHTSARRIIRREHFKVLWERNPADSAINTEAGQAIYDAAVVKFGAGRVRRDRYTQRGGAPNFPVQMRDDQVVSSLSLSETLQTLPVVSIDYVFVDRAILEEAKQWLVAEKDGIIHLREEPGNG